MVDEAGDRDRCSRSKTEVERSPLPVLVDAVGAVVRAVPHDRADDRRAGRRDGGPRARREAQRRREPGTAARFNLRSIPTLLGDRRVAVRSIASSACSRKRKLRGGWNAPWPDGRQRGTAVAYRRFGRSSARYRSSGRGPGTSTAVIRPPRSRRCAGASTSGMTHIDTAEMYGEGREKVVGEAIAGRRDEVFLVSKVLPENASRTRDARSLRALARPPRAPTISTATSCTGAAAPAGGDDRRPSSSSSARARSSSWGVSNFDVPDLDEIQPRSPATVGRLQPGALPSAGARDRARGAPWCEEHGVVVVAYSPFGHGRFPGPRTKGGRVLHEIADAHGATPRQVALRFSCGAARSSPFRRPPTPSTPPRTPARAISSLTDAELARIDRAFPRGPRPRSLPML